MHTEKITLLAPEMEDVEMMFEFENDEEVWEHGGATGPYSRFQLQAFVKENKNDLFSDGQLRLIMENAGGEKVGIVDIFSFDARNSRAELGIAVRRAYRQRGYAKEALRLLEKHCFEVLDLHNLYVYINKRNAASAKLFAGLGYRLVGELHDWVKVGKKYDSVELWQKVNR